MTKRITLLESAIIFIFVLLISASPVEAQQAQAGQETFIEDVEIRGNRRIPRESILYYVQSKQQDRFDQSLAQRDLQAILQMGLFDPLATKLFLEDGPRGGKIIIFQVKEYPIIRSLEYRGLKSATDSEILTRFKERSVKVGKESQFDPAKANGARIVIRELLAEKGHPDAKVEVEVEEISATTVALVFNIEEGPRVRVKEIEFVGDRDGFSQRRLRGAMKLVKESGLISTFTSKDIYFRDKLLDDLERVRFFLGTKGYLQAKIAEPKVEPAGKTSSGIPLPILSKSGPGLKITVPVEVGRRYKIKSVEEKGVTIFQPGLVKAVSQLREGEWADAKKIQENVFKGVKDLYGEYGYIQADVNPILKFTDKTAEEGEVEFTIEVDEGRQFSLRRLEFIGNTNTRDSVLRREVMLNEGDPYNKRYWDLSILRLNQLGLFDEIKEKDAITRTNDREQNVDIDVQVKEKGRQQIQLNGGVSGYAGSFFGIEYSTNNFLGYGETLSLAFSGGNRQIYALVGFTEPYFMGKPISLGVQVYAQQAQFVGQGYNFQSFQQLAQASVFGLSSIDASTLFTQRTYGGTISVGGPLNLFTKKFPKFGRLARLQMSYSLSSNKVIDPEANRDSDPTNNIPITYSYPAVLTSRLTPSIYYNSKCCNYLDPSRGQSLFLGFSLAGGFLGGDVNLIAPSLQYELFIPALRRKSEKPHVIAMRFRGDHIRSFGTPFVTDTLAFVGGIPIYERYFLGGENDIRGYNFRSVSPAVPYRSFASTQNPVAKVVDPNDPTRLIDAPPGTVHPSVLSNYTFQSPLDPAAGCGLEPSATCNIVPTGTFFQPIGGDTQFIYNLEYRVPIVSVLSVAAFADVGSSFNTRTYRDQIVKSEFIPGQNITSLGALTGGTVTAEGVLLNPSGRIATAAELTSAPTNAAGSPVGFRPVSIFGDSRSYSIVDMNDRRGGFFSDLRSALVSSLGMEVRVQMPVINVPFRLIFAYNPQANTDPGDPQTIFIERKTVVRFSVGRTF
ncbi:MAG: outer membrane protein assembly factor BamA [Acidobacteria bacterium]|nr:outer membrane protein assembly factor BamA [Acidobacteriota bacterium]